MIETLFACAHYRASLYHIPFRFFATHPPFSFPGERDYRQMFYLENSNLSVLLIFKQRIITVNRSKPFICCCIDISKL